MKVAPIYEVKEKLSEYVRQLHRGPVVITRNGRPCAALVSVSGDDLEAFLLAHHPRFMALLDRSHEEAKKRGGTPFSEVEKAVKRRSHVKRKQRRGAISGS